MRFTTSEVAQCTGGDVFGREADVVGVSIDSRTVEPGQLFVPIVAERDGHEFIAAAITRGAAAYLTSGEIGASTAIRVTDTSVALSALGAHARDRLHGHVVGITGSVGKTSAKDLLAAATSATWRTAASIGSFNNELGVPLTLANAPDDTEVAIVEMGARGIGHIATLCAVARPTIGLVTLVAGAHLEQFGTIEDVARAKGELIASLPPSGTAILNGDDHRVRAMAHRTDADVIVFGRVDGDVRVEELTIGPDLRARFTLRSPWGSALVHLGVAGSHQVTNALGAAAAALVLGTSIDAVAAGLAHSHLSANRMDLTTRADGLRILDDSYNANPTSMVAALEALAALDANRRFAVLGTMAELGDGAAEAHAEIVAAAHQRDITVISVAEARYEAVPVVDDPEGAIAALAAHGVGGPGDAVLVKASRSARLERVVALLRAG